MSSAKSHKQIITAKIESAGVGGHIGRIPMRTQRNNSKPNIHLIQPFMMRKSRLMLFQKTIVMFRGVAILIFKP